MKQGSGPRHIIVSKDNKFVYLLNELTATVTTLALDAKTGTLKEVDSASALPADTKLGPGQPRAPVAPGQTPRDVANDIWASDLHLTPDGKFLYAAERTSSSLGGFKVDAASGKLTFVGITPTEKQPRGFRIDPTGKFMIVSGEKSETLTVLCDRRGERRAEGDRQISDRQGLELGRDRFVRLALGHQHDAADHLSGAQVIERGLRGGERPLVDRHRRDFAGARERHHLLAPRRACRSSCLRCSWP